MLKKLSSKQVGAIVLIVSLSLGVSFLLFMQSTNASEKQACELACGGDCQSQSCPMNQPLYEKIAYYLLSSFIIVLGLLGGYLLFTKEEKLVLGEESKFDIILSVLNRDEKEVLKAVQKQEGIKQSTLKYRVEFSKSKLSNLLQDLEERGLIHREESGKTNEIFLKHNHS